MTEISLPDSDPTLRVWRLKAEDITLKRKCSAGTMSRQGIEATPSIPFHLSQSMLHPSRPGHRAAASKYEVPYISPLPCHRKNGPAWGTGEVDGKRSRRVEDSEKDLRPSPLTQRHLPLINLLFRSKSTIL